MATARASICWTREGVVQLASYIGPLGVAGRSTMSAFRASTKTANRIQQDALSLRIEPTLENRGHPC